MKYRDVITVFAGIGFFLTLAYVAGVDRSLWPFPLVIGICLIFIWFYLWRE